LGFAVTAALMMMRLTAVRIGEPARQDFFVVQVSLEKRFSCAVECPSCRMSNPPTAHSMGYPDANSSCDEQDRCSDDGGDHELTDE
jgi:hypothetical protein